MNNPNPQEIVAPTHSPNLRPILLIGLFSSVLYALLYFTQRALFLNGLNRSLSGMAEGGLVGNPANETMLLWQSMAYYGATVALFALYVWLLVLCRRGRLSSGWTMQLAIGFPAAFHLALLFGRPHLSVDLFSYLAHGYLGTLAEANPYTQAASEVAEMPFGPALSAFGWVPVHGLSPYGPLWTQLMTGVVSLTQNVAVGMLLLKAFVVAASLGSAALIWQILGRVRPEMQRLGTLVYLWNPVIVMELAAEGHNDALMIFFVLVALALAVRAQPTLLTATSVVAMALGALTKYLPLLFGPPLLVYLWRKNPNKRRVAIELAVGLLASAGLAVLLFSNLWVGWTTFEGVQNYGQADPSFTPTGALFRLLANTPFANQATQLTPRIMAVLLGLFVLALSWRVRRAETLLSSCAAIAFAYVLVASPAYWPWYATLPLALAALSPSGVLLWAAVVTTLCARLVAPLMDMAVNGFIEWVTALDATPAVGVTLPLIVVGLLLVWRALQSPLARVHLQRYWVPTAVGALIFALIFPLSPLRQLAQPQSQSEAPAAQNAGKQQAAQSDSLFVRLDTDEISFEQIGGYAFSNSFPGDASLETVQEMADVDVWTFGELPEGYKSAGFGYYAPEQRIDSTYEYESDEFFAQLMLIQHPAPPLQQGPDDIIGASAEVETVDVGGAEGEYVTGTWMQEDASQATSIGDDTPMHWTEDVGQMLRWQRGGYQFTLTAYLHPDYPGYLDRDALVALAATLSPPAGELALFTRMESDVVPTEELEGDMMEVEEGDWRFPLSLLEAEEIASVDVWTTDDLPEGYESGSFLYHVPELSVTGFYTYTAAPASDFPYNSPPTFTLTQQPAASANNIFSKVGASAEVQSVPIGDTTGEYVSGTWTGNSDALNLEWMNLPCCQVLRWQRDDLVFTLDAHNNAEEVGQLSRDELAAFAARLAPSGGE